MKSVLIVGSIFLVGTFFLFFNVEISGNNRLEFLESYKATTGYQDYTAEKVYSTDSDESGLLITFNGCAIDSTNIQEFGELSKDMAQKIHRELNSDKQHDKIMLVFKPKNPAGIQINEMISLNELKFSHNISELDD